MRQYTCCFTGHRDIPCQELQKVTARTEGYIRELIGKGIRFFGVGGAIGYDTLVAKMLFNLRATEYPSIKVILVYPFDGYISRWTPDQQEVYKHSLHYYDKKVCVASQPGRDAYLQRNRHLVDNSSYCISYCTRKSGGTAYTIRYAQSKGLVILNTAE